MYILQLKKETPTKGEQGRGRQHRVLKAGNQTDQEQAGLTGPQRGEQRPTLVSTEERSNGSGSGRGVELTAGASVEGGAVPKEQDLHAPPPPPHWLPLLLPGDCCLKSLQKSGDFLENVYQEAECSLGYIRVKTKTPSPRCATDNPWRPGSQNGTNKPPPPAQSS